MAEASSLSNVRIINFASNPIKIFQGHYHFDLSYICDNIILFLLAVRHFISDKITNLDALIDFTGKEKVIGELPFLELSTKKEGRFQKILQMNC